MLQEGGVDPRSTPRDVLRLHARLFRDPEDPEALLAGAGLEAVASTRYRRLSGGERQRLALALALLGRPELLVLDEPTAGMDPAAKQATRERIAGLRAAGTTILITTHELGDVERLADRVVVLDRGRVVAAGTPAELTGARVRPACGSGWPWRWHPTRRRRSSRPWRRGHGSRPTASPAPTSCVDLPAPPGPRLVAALAGWCGERDLLLDRPARRRADARGALPRSWSAREGAA